MIKMNIEKEKAIDKVKEIQLNMITTLIKNDKIEGFKNYCKAILYLCFGAFLVFLSVYLFNIGVLK